MVLLYQVEEREAARDRQRHLMDIVASLGGDAKSYKRERARRSRAIIAEFYSPPRVSALARDMPSYGIAPGLALDLTVPDENGEPWDFSRRSMRVKAERLLDEQAPTLLIGTPMCTAFSTWQYINNKKRDAKVVASEKKAGRMHLAWVCKLYAKQARAGRLFLHEHPAHATSWNEPCVLEVLQLTGVSRITADQCQLGQQAENGQPIMKQTGFMSNCADILSRLEKRCTGRRGLCSRPGGGTHQLCNGKTARRAAIFQRELCEEILIGLKEYLTRHRRMRGNEQLYTDGCGVMIDGDDDVQLHHRSGLHRLRSPADGLDDPAEMYFADGSELGSTGPGGCPPPADEAGAAETGVFDGILQVGRHDRYVDDLTGQPLPPELCKAARKTELDYFNDKDVWTLRKVSEALRRTGKPPITVRWVETNKGDDQCPKIRSRLVAREIRLLSLIHI